VNSGDTIIRAGQSLEGSNTLRSTVASVTFSNTGMTTLTTGSEIALRLCDSRGQNSGVTVYINYTGRTRTAQSVTSCT